MPAILEDPSSRNVPPTAHTTAAPSLTQRHTTLPKASGVGMTLYPIAAGPASLPWELVKFLHAEFSAEIERGSTYPMEQPLGLEQFADYWFGTFAVVAVLDEEGDSAPGGGLKEGRDWAKVCLGTFYIKPNYPGRCSHICNAGFLTTTAARGKGVGQQMGEAYLEFAPKLGYKYSVFNLVFANNPASIRIWERLGFSVIGRVPKAARLANSEELVDALIFGRELGN
ncbi:N-acetyltransferase MPR1 [Penicillium canariense]|uniref:N-acetyltransferase MPR1 n=1 Tax=Penicillium canariense TaxID=189055 RepID=A0A9W9LP91_9EURO|nr:N-acetyltransferase MPR1 [Penicillium canariense]KAJ5168729.1 N-acetyltransferase MPR1 [Penicillium canariense]